VAIGGVALLVRQGRALDAPADCDGYAVPERVIRQFFGERGVEAMLGDGCRFSVEISLDSSDDK
jgi:hypothetical protein